MADLPRNKKLKGNALKHTDKQPKGPAGGGNKGDKDKNSKLLGGGLPKRYGARGGYKGVSTKKVRRLTQGVLRDEIRDLRSQLRVQRRDAKQDKAEVRRDYRRGKQDLNYVHGETGDYINSLAGKNQAMFADQAAQNQQATAALQQMLGNTYSGAASGANAELARLGIQGGGDLGQLGADSLNAQAVAAQSGANAQSTLGMAGGNAQTAMQLLAGMNQGSHMQGIGQALNARNDGLAEVRTNSINNRNEIRRAMQDARSARRDMFFQLLQQLQQTGWSQYMDQQQLNLQRKALNKD